jgi:hypothetical protein
MVMSRRQIYGVDAAQTVKAFLGKARFETSFTIQDIYYLCRMKFSVLQRMPRQLHSYTPRRIMIIKLLCATYNFKCDFLTKTVLDVLQR